MHAPPVPPNPGSPPETHAPSRRSTGTYLFWGFTFCNMPAATAAFQGRSPNRPPPPPPPASGLSEPPTLPGMQGTGWGRGCSGAHAYGLHLGEPGIAPSPPPRSRLQQARGWGGEGDRAATPSPSQPGEGGVRLGTARGLGPGRRRRQQRRQAAGSSCASGGSSGASSAPSGAGAEWERRKWRWKERRGEGGPLQRPAGPPVLAGSGQYRARRGPRSLLGAQRRRGGPMPPAREADDTGLYGDHRPGSILEERGREGA